MPRATLASRTLKNRDTGLDLFVPTYKETKGLMSNIVHYQVVLVSSLSCFKAPSHKESDVVQYSVEKKFNDFEELRTKIAELFSGTVLPPMNKRSFIVNEQVLRERRNSLDTFVKFVASTRKLSTCQPLLEFLGVDLIRAKKFSRGESLDQNQKLSQSAQKEEEEEEIPTVDVFDEEEEEDEEEAENELFGDEEEGEKTGEESIFESGGIAVFDGQDLKRELTVDDEADFSFIPDGIITKKNTADTEMQEEIEDQNDNEHSELFEIDDDLDQLMNVKKEKKARESTDKVASSQAKSPEAPAKPKVAQKPQVATKPSIATKPTVPSKPQPGSKPSIPQKPGVSSSRPEKIDDSQKEQEKSSKKESDFVDNLGQDDILKYLQAHSESTNDDLDLFS